MGSSFINEEHLYFKETAEDWLHRVDQYSDVQNERIIRRFIRDVNTFIKDIHPDELFYTSDMIDLSDRFYVLEAIFGKIRDDRF